MAEGRQDTLAGLHGQAATLLLPAAQVAAALAEHTASEAWRTKALQLLRSTTPVAARASTLTLTLAQTRTKWCFVSFSPSPNPQP